MRTVVCYLGLWAAAVTAAGCAPQEHGARERLCAGHGCSAECRALEVDVCDIRDDECQDLIFKSLQCVRGDVLDDTPYLVVTESLSAGSFDGPEDLVHTRNVESAPTTGASNTTGAIVSATQSQMNQVTEQNPVQQGAETFAQRVFTYYISEGLRLLHLIEQTKTIECVLEEEEENVGAVEVDGTVKVESGNVGHRWLSMQLVAHEFVHAQQEVDYGGIQNLYAQYSNASKSRQGVNALLEGEAVLYGWLTHAFMRNTSIDDWALLDYFEQAARQKRRDIADMTSPLTHAQWWQHYAIGARVLAERWLTGHNLAVRSVRHNLKADFGAWVRDFAPPIGEGLGDGVTCAPPGTEMIVRDRLGPSGVFALLMAATKRQKDRPIEPAWQVARSVVDDRLDFFASRLPEGHSQAPWASKTPVTACEDQGVVGADAGAQLDAGEDSSVDADVRQADERDDAGASWVPPQVSDTSVPFGQLLPEGAVWVSWRLSFDTEDDARAFIRYFDEAEWRTVEFSQDDATVLIKGRRQIQHADEQMRFDAWDPWVMCTQ
jgi:hypothetical protein